MLQARLKRLSEKHVPKQAEAFSAEDLAKFFKETKNEGEFLQMKLACGFGFYGGMRAPSEVTYLLFDDITRYDSGDLKVRSN